MGKHIDPEAHAGFDSDERGRRRDKHRERDLHLARLDDRRASERRARWWVTPHAAQRYIERIDPTVSEEEAVRRCCGLSMRARLSHRCAKREVWVADGWIECIVEPRAAGLPHLVTVGKMPQHGPGCRCPVLHGPRC